MATIPMPMTKTANSKTTFDTTAKPNTPIFLYE